MHCCAHCDPTLQMNPASAGHWYGWQVSELQLHGREVQTASVRHAGLGLSAYVHVGVGPAAHGPPFVGGAAGHSWVGVPWPPSGGLVVAS
jgi:hypothetical protein